MRSELVVLLLHLSCGLVELNSDPPIPDAWEDMVPLSKKDLDKCILAESLRRSDKEDKSDVESLRTFRQNLREALQSKVSSDAKFTEGGRNTFPVKVKEIFETLLRSQKCPDGLIEKCCEEDESKAATKTPSLDRLKLKMKHAWQNDSKLGEMTSDRKEDGATKETYYSSNLSYVSRCEILLDLILMCRKRISLTKLKLTFKELRPSAKGVLERLSYDECKSSSSIEPLCSSLIEEMKLVNAVVTLASKFCYRTSVQSQELMELCVEHVAFCLTLILTHAINTTSAVAKRDSFREDDFACSLRSLVPLFEQLLNSLPTVVTSEFSHLVNISESMVAWLMVSFLYGLSKSQYSVSMERQNSTKAANYKRSFSRSISCRFA